MHQWRLSYSPLNYCSSNGDRGLSFQLLLPQLWPRFCAFLCSVQEQSLRLRNTLHLMLKDLQLPLPLEFQPDWLQDYSLHWSMHAKIYFPDCLFTGCGGRQSVGCLWGSVDGWIHAFSASATTQSIRC